MTQGVFLKNSKLKLKGKIVRSSPTSPEEEQCCNNPSITNRHGEKLCTNCGLVFSQVIDDTPSYGFTHEEHMKNKVTERVYRPIGPRTILSGRRDARGNALNSDLLQKYKRMAKIHRSLITSKERNLWKALSIFRRLRKALNIPQYVYKDAFRIYDLIIKRKLTLGRSIRILVTASAYSALRVNKIVRTIDEMVEVSQFPRNKILRAYKLICRNILPDLNLEIKRLPIIQYVDKFTNFLDLSVDCRNYALKLLSLGKKNGFRFSGKNPKGIAGGALYLSAEQFDNPKTQKEIANTLNVTEVTLRSRIKELRRLAN